MSARAPAVPEPVTFEEAQAIRWKAQRGYRATPDETARLAFAAMTTAINIHICTPDETGGLDR